MEWEKLGNIFNPKIAFHPKLYTHASNPLPVHLNNDIYRIYYNGRDKQNRSSIGAIEYDIISGKLTNLFKNPLFLHDNENSYYSDGVSIGSQYSIGGDIYMLFMGWKILDNGFWQGEIGRLKIENDGAQRLLITGMISDDNRFFVDQTNFFINPENSKILDLVFRPVNQDPLVEKITIQSNVGNIFVTAIGGIGTSAKENKFALNLKRGLNLISIPLDTGVLMSASIFANQVGATLIIQYDTEKRNFVSFIPNFDRSDFQLVGGKGYIVNLLDDYNIVFKGHAWNNVDTSPSLISNIVRTWVFALVGRVEFPDLSLVKATNSRNGLEWEGQVGEGQFKAIIIDPNQQSIVQTGDRIDISVFDREGTLVSETFVIYVNQQDIVKAYRVLRLKPRLILDRTRLLPNYPNPSNPETWIPFEINQDSEVSITIYDISGTPVRTIRVGYVEAGSYISQSRAIYWEGKTDTGGRISSGIYFYTLRMGTSICTRKMIVLK